jgi:hypothetical protein
MTPEPTNPTLPYASPGVEPGSHRNRTAVVFLFLALVLGGLACALLASLIFDRGRGSPAAVGVSCGAVAASPLSCVAWALRRTRAGKWVGLLLLAAGFVADVILIFAFLTAGTDFLTITWKYDPRLVMGWVTLWTIWQALAAASLVPGEVRLR